jgi:spermidine synthase
LVFATSGLVLVLEIIAARLVAPYVGISLESFTAIIGTVLAGIAAGAAIGGRLADSNDPARLIGPIIVAGGVLSWLSVPIVRSLGPSMDSSAASTVVLVAAAFLLPAAVVSAVGPMVAKLTLGSVDETGTVVGGLSAAGTAGALAGTFLTGFVLVAVLPIRAIVFLIGAVLVVIGVAVAWWLRRDRPTLPGAAAAVLALVALFGTSSICDHETEYYCVRIEAEPGEPRHRSLWLDQLRHGFVDLDDPTHHDIRYVRLLAAVVDTLAPGPIDALHIGGAAFTIPRYVEATRPGSDQLVFEIDRELVDIAERELGLTLDDRLRVRVGDARLAFRDLDDDRYDLIVGDAFGSEAVPWHLTTVEVVAELDRLLRDGGIYAVNLIDGPDGRFAAAQAATLAEHFDHVAVIDPSAAGELPELFNRIVLASNEPLVEPRFDPADGRFVAGDPWGDGRVLTDDFAPVDQLIG